MKQPKNEEEKVILNLALSHLATPKPEQLIKDINFLFKAIHGVNARRDRFINKKILKIQKKNPKFSFEECVDYVVEDKKQSIRFLNDSHRTAIYCECLILQIAGWINAVVAREQKLLEQYSRRKLSSEAWINELLTVGPKCKKGYWAKAMRAGGNLVRHFDEWDYKKFERCGPNNKLRLSKNILKSLKDKKARKTVQALFEVGVNQDELFGLGSDGPLAILRSLNSESANSLLDNCTKWLMKAQEFTRLAVFSRDEKT